MPNDLTPGQSVKVWLLQQDKTQRWLSVRLKISESKLSNILSGHETPDAELAKKIGRVTGIEFAVAKVA